jgi:hypothetical protein
LKNLIKYPAIALAIVTSSSSFANTLITANDLYEAFDSNEISAESRYKGKEIIITGNITNIKKNIAGQPIVRIDAGMLKFISARFPKNSMNQLASMKKGVKAKFLCVVEYKILRTVHLSNCSIK